VIVAVQTRQVLRELVIDGAQRVSAKKLRKEIGVKLNSPVMKMIFRKRAKDHRQVSKQGFHRHHRGFPGRADRREPRDGACHLHGQRRREGRGQKNPF